MKLQDAEQLIRSLSETRSVEVKSWFDLTSAKGKSKLVKGLQALRNFNGGQLVIGFENSSMQPDLGNIPSNVRQDFHADNLQELVAKYSSTPFDVDVLYPELNGQEFIVISVPSGVKSPVVVKKELRNEGGGSLLEKNDIYFRTLLANNTVSTAKIPYQDWPDLMQICFDNREADIGRFVRRHLNGLSSNFLAEICKGQSFQPNDPPSADEMIDELLDDGRKRFDGLVEKYSLSLPQHGSMEIGLHISGDAPEHFPDQTFLRRLAVSNPSLTGWPIWIDSSGFRHQRVQPFVLEGGWEEFAEFDGGGVLSKQFDFMRKDPEGLFYLRRPLQDDTSVTDRGPLPNTQLDFGLSILRVAEAIAVGKAFATALEYESETTTLEFGFRWAGLEGRVLSSWANPERFLRGNLVATQNEITCRTTVPLFASQESISEYTYDVVSPLFRLFSGFEISTEVVEDFVTRLLERRLR